MLPIDGIEFVLAHVCAIDCQGSGSLNSDTIIWPTRGEIGISLVIGLWRMNLVSKHEMALVGDISCGIVYIV